MGRVTIVALFLSMLTRSVSAQGFQLSGGVDSRYTHESNPTADDVELRGVFVNFRKVWSDETGDRWIAVGQADFDHNFEDVRPYQVYLQYKGPLGRWNARAGHFLLPFGLLATYDTERLLLQGLENTSLGIRKDTGLEALGRFGSWDYSLAVTEGVGDRRLTSIGTELATARIAHVSDDWQLGVSALVGRVLTERESEYEGVVIRERRLGFDTTRSLGPLTLRAELLGGTDDGRAVGGGIALVDYALNEKLELNTRLAYWRKDGDHPSLGLGLTYHVHGGLYLRIADNYEFGERKKNVFTAQVYFDFSKQF